MATTFTADQAQQNWPALNADEAGDVIAVRGAYSLTAALVINDVIEMCKIPAQHTVVDVILDCDDLDTGTPAIVLSVGYAGSGNSAKFIAASTAAQAGGIARMDVATRFAPVNTDTKVVVKVTTAPATGTTTGIIGVTVLVCPAQNLD